MVISASQMLELRLEHPYWPNGSLLCPALLGVAQEGSESESEMTSHVPLQKRDKILVLPWGPGNILKIVLFHYRP